jgi:hypothetical protein
MNRSLILFATLALTINFKCTVAQDVVEKITIKACECMLSVDTTLNADAQEEQLGVCILKCASPYKKELKSKYGINFDLSDKEAMEKVGELVGIQMAKDCPNTLLRLTSITSKTKDDASTGGNEKTQLMVGNVTDIQNEQFRTVLFKEINGREQKLLWLEYFPNAQLLDGDMPTLKTRELKINYIEKEFYNPKIKDYIKYKIIVGVALN